MKLFKCIAYVLLALVLAVVVPILIVCESVRFKPRRWLAQHEVEATRYAQSVLSHQQAAVPASLTNSSIEVFPDMVSFGYLVGPFYSYGMAYSLSGSAPSNGLGAEPRVLRWERARGHWYYWVAD